MNYNELTDQEHQEIEAFFAKLHQRTDAKYKEAAEGITRAWLERGSFSEKQARWILTTSNYKSVKIPPVLLVFVHEALPQTYVVKQAPIVRNLEEMIPQLDFKPDNTSRTDLSNILDTLALCFQDAALRLRS